MGVRLGLSAKVTWWFFDIVDFDEGTCGRRRLRSGVFGLGSVGKLGRSLYVHSYPLRLKCRHRLLKFMCLGLAGFTLRLGCM